MLYRYKVEHVHEAYNAPDYDRPINRALERFANDGWEVVSVSMLRDGAQSYYNGGSDKTYIVTLRRTP